MRDVNGGWRIDRRTFLKAMGLGAAGLVLGVPLSSVRPSILASPAVAASDPIADLAVALEFDLERIFRFVSEQIRYEPYAGLLRGPQGTLMARAGNSVDQAALLAALLEASAIPYRYAFGRLDDATADTLLASGDVAADAARQQLLAALAGTAEGGRPLVVGEPDTETRRRLDELTSRAGQVVDWARQQMELSVSDIESTLASAGIKLPGSFSGLPDLERDRHTWLQAASGPTWLDLDAVLPGAQPSTVPATADELLDTLPDDLRHAIRVAVVGETFAGGSLRDETLVEATDFADVLVGQPLGVLNMPPGDLKGVGISIVSAIEGGVAYVPCLVLGETVVVGARPLRFGAGDGAGMFGDVGGASATPGVADGEPTAEWVELTITSPGDAPVVVRRPVFDRVGLAARSAGAVDVASLLPTDLIRFRADGPAEYMPAQTTHWFTVHTGTTGGEALGAALRGTETDETLAGIVHGYHVTRDACGVELALPAGVRPFVTAPNVVAVTVEQDALADGSIEFRPTLDIWHRSFGVRPDPSAAATVETAPPVRAGVVSHVAERLLLGDALPDGPGAASVGAVFDAARREGVPLRVVQDATAAAALPLTPDALARLQAALGNGSVAVLPERPVDIGGVARSGWWLVDPVSGATVDEMDSGGGQVEYGRVVIIPVRAAPAFSRLGCFLAAAAFTVNLGMFGVASAGAMVSSDPTVSGVATVVAAGLGLNSGVLGGVVSGVCFG